MTTTRNTQRMTILAQDPAVRLKGNRLAVSQVDVPAEDLALGPTGYRLKVVDFDATADRLYLAHRYERNKESGELIDPWAPPKEDAGAAVWKRYEERLLNDPQFHAQNAYAIAMRVLARFEFALGRRVCWGFAPHQLQIAPHAFCDANAFYSEDDQALLFGYFPGRNGRPIFTCLSHDIVAHETTHALVDGMRDRYTERSSPDQAAFHEGFADVVALLSMFSLEEIVQAALRGTKALRSAAGGIPLVSSKLLTREALQNSILFGLGKQIGLELEPLRRDALRRSITIAPAKDILTRAEFLEPHRRGEVFVAAFLRAFLDIWVARIEQLGTFGRGRRNLSMVIEEGVKAADHLLTIGIRALDYCPATDIDFPDYLAGMLTADTEVVPDDRKHHYRKTLLEAFAAYGIAPPASRCHEDGTWRRYGGPELSYSRTHFESMLRDKEEVFRFIWENREALDLRDGAYAEVQFVRASTRVGPDGFVLRETVCEYVEVLELFGAEVRAVLGFERPAGMSTQQRLKVFAGGTLVFDEYGKVKYHIHHPFSDTVRLQHRIEYLQQSGQYDVPEPRDAFAALHRNRALS